MKSNSRAYLIIIAVLGFIGVTSITAIAIFQPASNNTLVITTIIGFLTPIMLFIQAMMQKETHDINDGRLSELLEVSKRASKAEGKLEEQKESE